jgi:hypothetical protein
MCDSETSASKRPFPLNVVPSPGGWTVAILMENGELNQLLKPGWREDNTQPYVFSSEDEAWSFIKQLFKFCLQQARLQHDSSDKVRNCTECGRVFRARFFDYCHDCLQANEFMLQQIWQGFYYLAGSEEGALHKAALLLKLPQEEFAQVPEAFQRMIQHHLALHSDLEKQRSQTAQQLRKHIAANTNTSGLRSSMLGRRT